MTQDNYILLNRISRLIGKITDKKFFSNLIDKLAR